ncbi:hypothetical protein ACTI_60600 [Actinoplanes sp. OR16]|uniref:phage tail protein n=1 Tax=Actinoplanes sp. OR16 TaxID=946334 RepID=UPI000F6B3870|nr:phage tail protein [Actinoplanes sp. OR16]BBH69375.1 hypothetical protein ACTI_60600 [Actinoplanes sp. OR16]
MTFRLLDAYVGWDPSGEPTLAGLDDPAGVRLPRLGPAPDGPGRDEVLPWFPDRRLAPAGRAAWYLLTGDAVRRRDGCSAGFAPVRSCGPQLREPVAVAACGHWLAVAGATGLLIWWREGDQVTGVAPGVRAARLAVAADGTVLAADATGTVLHAYAADGRPRYAWETGLDGRMEGIRFGRQGRVWLLTAETAGGRESVRLWSAQRIGSPPGEAALADLAAELPPSTLAAVTGDGFCLNRPETVDTDAGTDCFDWRGEPATAAQSPAAADLAVEGELNTVALDSGIPRCRWHRVRVDADVPDGATAEVSVAATEDPGDAGLPHESDWQLLPAGATDALVDQPPGRYLYLRLRLTSDGRATPLVRRIRLDFPRATSADLLPAAFREDPAADDFAERFLSLFDATVGDADRIIERYPALLDGRGVPGEVLPWLGGLLGLAFEAGWSEGVRRELIAAAPELYRRRGTPAGVSQAVRIVFGADPVIHELGAARAWMRLGTGGRLGVTHLFGRSRARMRVGSALAGAPLASQGDPYGDPLAEHAYRLRVQLPPTPGRRPDLDALARLVRSQAPAHTVAEVHGGGLGWVVGARSVVGVDTALVPLPPAVLGSAAAEPLRLNRQSVLGPARRGPHRGIAVGERATVGTTTVVW